MAGSDGSDILQLGQRCVVFLISGVSNRLEERGLKFINSPPGLCSAATPASALTVSEEIAGPSCGTSLHVRFRSSLRESLSPGCHSQDQIETVPFLSGDKDPIDARIETRSAQLSGTTKIAPMRQLCRLHFSASIEIHGSQVSESSSQKVEPRSFPTDPSREQSCLTQHIDSGHTTHRVIKTFFLHSIGIYFNMLRLALIFLAFRLAFRTSHEPELRSVSKYVSSNYESRHPRGWPSFFGKLSFISFIQGWKKQFRNRFVPVLFP